MSPPISQALSRLIRLRFACWQHPIIPQSRLPRGHQSHLMPHAGKNAWLTFTPSLPSRTAYSQASLPTRSTATSTFSSLIQRSLVTVSPATFTIASSPRCAPLTPRGLPLLPVLPHDPSLTATASNSTARSASSAVALTSDGLPCTSNSAMNESSNQSIQPTARVYVSFLCWPRGRLILCLLNGYALL